MTVRIEAFRAFDMREMIFEGAFALTRPGRIEIKDGDRKAIFTGDFGAGSGGEISGTLRGLTLRIDGATAFEAAGLERYAGTAMRLARLGDNDAFAAYTLSGDDQLRGSGGRDYFIAFGGDDTLHGRAGDDDLFGGSDADLLYGGAGDDLLAGGLGIDRLAGGSGDDTYLVDQTRDVVVEKRGAGTDLVLASASYALADHVENLTLTGTATIKGRGNDGANVLRGNAADNVLRGKGGRDELSGGDGDDTLIGGDGRDLLTGGRDADVFRFDTPRQAGEGSMRDVILDFRPGEDRIDLARIDADAGRRGDQKFDFIGSDAFSGDAGELQVRDGRVSGDVDGDGRADFSIDVASWADLSAADFLL